MAASTWTKTKGLTEDIYHYTTTVNSTDGSEILALDPHAKVTYAVNHGGTDTVAVNVFNGGPAPAAAGNMVAYAAGLTADKSDALAGPFTAIQISSNGTASHVITVCVLAGEYGA